MNLARERPAGLTAGENRGHLTSLKVAAILLLLVAN